MLYHTHEEDVWLPLPPPPPPRLLLLLLLLMPLLLQNADGLPRSGQNLTSDWSLTLASVCRNGRWRSARLKIFRCMCDSTNRSNVQPLLDHQQRHAAFKPTALRSKVAPIPLPAGSTRPASAV